MSKLSDVWVFSGKMNRMAELVAGAAAVGEKITAIVIGSAADARTAITYGATAAFVIPKQDELIYEDYVPTVAKIVRDSGNAGMVFIPAGKRGKCLAAKLGAALNGAVVNEAMTISTDDGIIVSHMVYGGLAIGREKINTPVVVLTIAGGTFQPLAVDALRSGEIKVAPFVAPPRLIKLLKRIAQPEDTGDLGSAKRVVGVGRGFAKKEDIALAEELAHAIGGEVGCSGPVAEAQGWMERKRYIGVSGVMLKSDAYFAIGVSGQIQHMVGASGAKIIIAVNKDKNAPIFSSADYGIVGDLYKVIPAVIAALK